MKMQASYTLRTRRNENKMKSRMLISITAITVLAAVAIPQQFAAQDNRDDKQAKILTFEAPQSGTGLGQGTRALGINPAGAITGFTRDAGNVRHGFLRARDGAFTMFDAPGAGTGPGQGTRAYSINPGGAIAGWYSDASGVVHGYLRARDGSFTTFDVPGAGGAGTGPYPGTLASFINPAGAITGLYTDTNYAAHGFVRAPDGTITTFDAPGAGTGSGEGTFVETPPRVASTQLARSRDTTAMQSPVTASCALPTVPSRRSIPRVQHSPSATASIRRGPSPEKSVTRADWLTASCAPRTAASQSSTLQALAPASTKVLAASASTRRGRSRDTSLTRTTQRMVSFALAAAP